jgi:hypothetical protein
MHYLTQRPASQQPSSQRPSSQQPDAMHSSLQQSAAPHSAVQQSAPAATWATTGARFVTLTSARSAGLEPHPVSQQSASQTQSADPQLPSQQSPEATHSSPQRPAAQPCPVASAQLSTAATAAVSTQHAAPSTQHASCATQQSGRAASFAVQQDGADALVSAAVFAGLSPANPTSASSAVVMTDSPEIPKNFANMDFAFVKRLGSSVRAQAWFD